MSGAARKSGFTLVEVMVALAIMSLVILALLKANGENARLAGALEERMLAEIAAENQMITLLLDAPFPELGKIEGETLFAGREFYWESTVSETPDPALRRVEISIRAAEDGQVTAQITTFRGAQ